MIKGSRLPSFEEKNPIKDLDEICSSIHKNKTHNSILMMRCNSLDTYNLTYLKVVRILTHLLQNIRCTREALKKTRLYIYILPVNCNCHHTEQRGCNISIKEKRE